MDDFKVCDSCGGKKDRGPVCDAVTEDGTRCTKRCQASDGFVRGSLIGEWDDQTVIMDLCKEDFEKALKFLGDSSRVEYRATAIQ